MRRLSLFVVLCLSLAGAVAWGRALPEMLATAPATLRLNQPTPGVQSQQARPAHAALTFLFGRTRVGTSARHNRAQSAEAFRFDAKQNAAAGAVAVYVPRPSTAKILVAGLYADRAGHPESLLASGSKSISKSGRWVTVAIKRTKLVKGLAYWIAVLGERGMLATDSSRSASCRSTTDPRAGLVALPRVWPQSALHRQCISGYVSGWQGIPGTRPGANPVRPSPTTGTSTTSGSTTGTTTATAPVPLTLPLAPVNTALPATSGTAQQGDILSASNGSWSNNPTSYGYQWQDCSSLRSCSNISGATNSTYTVQSSDVGDTVDVVVTATNRGGSASATSAQTGVVTAGGGSSGSCGGSVLCVRLPETATAFAGHELGTQDSGYVWSAAQSGASGGPTVWQRLQSLDASAQRQVGYPSSVGNQTWVSPVDYTENGSSYTAWNFIDADQALSMAPPSAAKDYDVQWPDPMFYCPSGSWATGCASGGQAAGFADQSYGALASLYSSIVTYFTYPMAASGSGGAVTYTANSVTDTSGDLAGAAGDCVTATVFDNYGSPEWVTGTIASVSGNTATLSANWSTSESWSAYLKFTSIPSSTPVAGAAYNVSPCRPPGQLSGGSGAASAKPWPRPPSVGTVTHYELGNEPDDGGSGVFAAAPSLTAPAPTLTGVNVGGGTLTPGATYTYELAAAGGEGSGASLWGGGGGLTTPGTRASITLPAGDNAVRVSWNRTSSNGLTPYSYVVYGRTSSQLGLAAVGRDAVTPNASSFSWVDTGTITPSGAPNTTNQSGGGQPITPGSYVSIWDVVAPAMKAAGSADGRSVKIMGPVAAGPALYYSSYVDSRCVTTDGLNSKCANGDASWSPEGSFEQALLTLGNPAPDVLTFHTYGTDFGDNQTPESANFADVPGYLISHYGAVKALDDARGVPIWITENNYNSGSEPAGEYAQMLQLGSAWLAWNFIEWTNAEPNVQALIQWAIAGAATGEMFFEGYASGYNSSNCRPQPTCANLVLGEPGLNYWTEYEIDRLMGPGHIVTVSNVPSGYGALAVQTDPTHVTLAVVNTQQGADNGLGGAGTVNIQLQGANVTDTQETTINGSTNMSTGPSTRDLGAQSSVTANMGGYEVDLYQFTIH